MDILALYRSNQILFLETPCMRAVNVLAMRCGSWGGLVDSGGCGLIGKSNIEKAMHGQINIISSSLSGPTVPDSAWGIFLHYFFFSNFWLTFAIDIPHPA